MQIDESRPVEDEAIIYRCSCGCDVLVDRTTGGKCAKCERVVSTKVLNNDLTATMTLTGSFASRQISQVNTDNNYDPTELVGRNYGHYEIIEPLGSGGAGFVYKALDTSLQRYVAVKVLRCNVGETARPKDAQSEVELLLQEAVAQARVAHPNIVTVYFVGKENDEPFYAMELVDGISLSERIRHGKIEFNEIASVAADLVRALAFSFELDIIHGDIKPSNILLSQSVGAKLSDFGLARRASEKEKLATGGTPNYIAPEILFGSIPTLQSDMYALGVTLFEMTFGKLPIQLTGTTVASWQDCHNDHAVEFPAEWPENLPPQWHGFLNKLLAKDPKKRHSTYQDLGDDLAILSPASNVPASPLPRIIATVIDWVTVLLFMLPFRIAIDTEAVTSRPIWGIFILVLYFFPIVAYTILVGFWKQSVGRKLMQLRVLNRFGIIPKGRKMALRSFFRMILQWMMAMLLVCMFAQAGSWGVVQTVVLLSALTLLFVDAIYLLFNSRNKSLHDLIFETQVVIDS